MNETDAAFGCFRQYIVWNTVEIIGNCVHRIDHDPLRCSRMRALTLERDCGGARAPRFITNLAELFAVNRVSELRSEALNVKLLDASTDFFIGRERDRECSVFDLRILTQDVDHRHDLGAT